MEFKQKIMAAAAFDEASLERIMPDWRKYIHHEKAYVSWGARWQHEQVTPLLTRLVDEVEVLKAALDKIHDTDFAASVRMPIIAEEALEAHQKRWEDLK